MNATRLKLSKRTAERCSAVRATQLNSFDFSFLSLLQAQASKAQVVGLANAGKDAVQAIQQAAEFGLMRSGQKLAALLMYDTDVHAIGLQTAQGMLTGSAYYWDRTEASRAFSKRSYFERVGKMPKYVPGGRLFPAHDALSQCRQGGRDRRDGRRDEKDERHPDQDDFYASGGRIREDGRMVHDFYLVEVKKPSESKYAWDYFKILATIPGGQGLHIPLSPVPLSFAQKK